MHDLPPDLEHLARVAIEQAYAVRWDSLTATERVRLLLVAEAVWAAARAPQVVPAAADDALLRLADEIAADDDELVDDLGRIYRGVCEGYALGRASVIGDLSAPLSEPAAIPLPVAVPGVRDG